MRRLVAISSILGLCLFGCSEESKEDSKDNGASKPNTEDASGKTDEGTAVDEGDDPLFQLGMPDFCSLETKDSKACFECTPRELPLTKCVEIPNQFDAAKDCQHDLDKLTCDAAEFDWDFNDRDKMEAMYERLPVIGTIVKALLAKQYKDKPETVGHITSMLDLVLKHRKNIFTGQNLDVVAKEGVKIIKTIKPDLKITDEQAEEGLKNILAVLDKKRKSGELNEADVLKMLGSMFGQMPIELGDLTEQLNDPDAISNLAKDLASDLLGGGQDDGNSDDGNGQDTGSDDSDPDPDPDTGGTGNEGATEI